METGVDKLDDSENSLQVRYTTFPHDYKYILTIDCTIALHKGQGGIVAQGRCQPFLSMCFLTRASEHSEQTHAWPQGRNTLSTCQKKDKILIGKSS